MKKLWVSAFGFIVLLVTAVAWASPVPDTGQTKCYNATVEIPCPSAGQPFYGQDANYSINPMSYTKLDGSGNALPDTATSWVTVRDNVTGLIWEMKTNKDGVKNYNDPHDADNTYTWYDSNPATNGGNAGTPGNGTDTEDFIKALNDANYGGFSDWRMPTNKELAYIVKYSNSSPFIDTGYFPNTQQPTYWSSSTKYAYSSYAWFVSFIDGGGNYYGKDDSIYARAVRGGQSGLLGNYTDNGDGTVTDTSTGLMWQQAGSSNTQTWEQALAYCEGLAHGGYTDWRLPTIKELRSLVEYSRYNPAINTTFFPNTASGYYWSSTTSIYYAGPAWSVDFDYGYVGSYDGKYVGKYVRAVRGGLSLDHSVISVSPASQAVSKDAGTITFSVSNTGTGSMPWTASVTSGGSWLTITSGASGSNAGTINCSFTENTSTSARTATIHVTATGATGSPQDVTVTQVPTVCMATLDGNLSLHIPVLSYLIPYWGAPSYWADFVYEYNPSNPISILFKLTNAEVISNPTFTCTISTISNDMKIHIPDLLLPDGLSHLWVDLEYSAAFSTGGSAYFVVTGYGSVSN